MHIGRNRRRRQVRALDDDGIHAPGEQDDHHDGGDLHDLHGFFAGFFDALEVFPPVIDGHRRGKEGRGVIHVELEEGMGGSGGEIDGQPSVAGGDGEQLVEQAGNILSRGNTRDGAGEDVVKHECGDAKLGEGAAQRLLDDAIDAAAGEHGTALDINRAHREGEEHDAENEPGGGFADGFLSDTPGVERRRTQVAENDGSRSPEGDKGEHHGRGHNQPDPVGHRCMSSFRSCHRDCDAGLYSDLSDFGSDLGCFLGRKRIRPA